MSAKFSAEPAVAVPISDVQGGDDVRAVAINRVGICGLRLPMLLTESSTPMPTVGEWSCYTDLPADARGTHMSRLVRAAHDISARLNFACFCQAPAAVLLHLPFARTCDIAVRFRAFADKRAPISGERGLVDFLAAFYVRLHEGELRRLLSVTVPVTSLCPCSKTISKYGAHNQRSHVTCELEAAEDTRLLDVMAMVEEASSCELYSVLKRQDERHVTERAYDNPKFVEDIVRDLAVGASRLPGVRAYRVSAENLESIHNHSAFAEIESDDFPAAMVAGVFSGPMSY